MNITLISRDLRLVHTGCFAVRHRDAPQHNAPGVDEPLLAHFWGRPNCRIEPVRNTVEEFSPGRLGRDSYTYCDSYEFIIF